jgi:hypothetical protein
MSLINKAANNSSSASETKATSKPKKSLNFGSMDDVYEAVLAGHQVYSVNVNFSQKVAFGPKSALKTIGGAFTSTNEGDRAFMKFMPMGYTMKDGEPRYISEGTTTVYKLVDCDEDELAELHERLPMLNDAAKKQLMNSVIVNENIDFEAWQAIAADNNVGGEIAFEFNCAHWDKSFVQQLGAKTIAVQVKSLSIFFVLNTNPNGTAKCSDIVEVLKPKDGEPVYGRFFETAVIAATWNEGVFYTPKYKNEIAVSAFSSTVSSVLNLQKKINGTGSIDGMKKQVEAKNQFGNKAVANAKTVFEAELQAGKWNKFVESKLQELAKSTQFPGWSLLACKAYLAEMKDNFADVEYVDEFINIKGMANAVNVVTKSTTDSVKQESVEEPKQTSRRSSMV